ncbi:hypothetical protein Athai_12170 [Actinocatenispora thailandica]|uniref:Uncharacterized protein n=1 Tax=Actinocatenispora thailandica TaxID=227318 RepID=A0A7R7DL27_9ACTN|nr:hypothetical protein [Actinocatenispora thailandica]BCJ33714.1 hypothetical protein Athai_12170 [Actinocatenispora thailandica]
MSAPYPPGTPDPDPQRQPPQYEVSPFGDQQQGGGAQPAPPPYGGSQPAPPYGDVPPPGPQYGTARQYGSGGYPPDPYGVEAPGTAYGAPPAAPGYPAPGYPAPGYSAPGYPAAAPPVPAKKSRTGLIITLVCAGAVLLVLCGIGGYAFVQGTVGIGLGAKNSATTLSTPNSAGGLTKKPNDTVAASMKRELDGEDAFATTIGAAYTNGSDTTVYVWGGTMDTTLDSVANHLDDFFSGLSGDSVTVSGKHSVDPPSAVGGSMKCAKVSLGSSGSKGGVCAWADRVALVGVMSLTGGEPPVETLTGKLLPDVVHKGGS